MLNYAQTAKCEKNFLSSNAKIYALIKSIGIAGLPHPSGHTMSKGNLDTAVFVGEVMNMLKNEYRWYRISITGVIGRLQPKVPKFAIEASEIVT